jgi:hypothetical protein
MIVGNVGAEGVAVRDKIFIQMDGLCDLMIKEIGNSLNLGITEKICWVLSVLMKDAPTPSSIIVNSISLLILLFSSLKMSSTSANSCKDPSTSWTARGFSKWKRSSSTY